MSPMSADFAEGKPASAAKERKDRNGRLGLEEEAFARQGRLKRISHGGHGEHGGGTGRAPLRRRRGFCYRRGQ